MIEVSLCIPTFRRAEKLAGMLPALLGAIDRHPQKERFEVCLSDNASPDATPEVVAEARRCHGRVAFRDVRQPSNLGFAGNFHAVARLATGRTFAIFADDDAIRPDALDHLLTAASGSSESQPLAVFNSLPGADILRRGQRLPSGPIMLPGVDAALATLGIFQMSFVTNLLFHRETALKRWPAEAGRSRYPHMVVALALLKHGGAVYRPEALVDAFLPPDAGDQPLLTCVDMARVMTDHGLSDGTPGDLVRRTYRYLLQMVPTAVYQARTGRAVDERGNPYAELSARNLADCYRRWWPARAAAVSLYLTAKVCPLFLLRTGLRLVSRHPR
jgi:glycosyltransferase involved in cell wall biosynthesis